MSEKPSLSAADFTIVEVPYDDPRGDAIRTAMNEEMYARYDGAFDGFTEEAMARASASMDIDPAEVIVSFMAFAPDGSAAAHAMLRDHDGEWEVKRVVTTPAYRGTGIGSRIMGAVHDYAREHGAARVVLQTGDRQPDAVALYVKLGYHEIPVYEPYKSDMPNSLCYAKTLAP